MILRLRPPAKALHELLRYYLNERLETLPNIDINIKSGNLLISRFALDEDLSEVFRRQKLSRQDYLLAVQAYKTARQVHPKICVHS